MRASIISKPHLAQCGRLIETRYDSDGVKDFMKAPRCTSRRERYRTRSHPGQSSERLEIKANSTAENRRGRSASGHTNTLPPGL